MARIIPEYLEEYTYNGVTFKKGEKVSYEFRDITYTGKIKFISDYTNTSRPSLGIDAAVKIKGKRVPNGICFSDLKKA